MKRSFSVVLFSLLCAVSAFGEEAPTTVPGAIAWTQFSAGYVYQGSQPTFGDNSFGMNGGRADVMLPLNKHIGLVGEFSGVHTGSVPLSSNGLTLFTYMAGPRLSIPLRGGRELRRVVPFAQVLFGGVHATDGMFPSGSTMSGTANSFAMSAGGGLQVGVNRRLSVRLVQADYLYTRLPNLFDNYQNSYRIGAGVVLRLH